MPMTKPTSEQVTFLAAGAGASQRTVLDKLRDVVSVRDFGAVGDGVADDTAAIQAAFDYAIPLGRTVILSGTYKVTGPIQSNVQIPSGQLHIVCDGSVSINVANGSTPFYALMYFYTVASNNVSITGGTLSVNLNSIGATAFYLRRLDSDTQAGVIDIQTPITVLNAHNKATSGAFSTGDNGGIIVFGNYARVTIMSPTVIGVTRDAAAGVCRGITVGQYSGEVTILRPYIKNVLTGAGSADADGIAVSGAVPTGGSAFVDKRLGRSVIIEPTFVDCQGRSFKSQCSDCTVIAPTVFRKDVVSIASGVDFDFQRGDGRLISPRFEYRLNGGTSPLGVSFSPVAFQNTTANSEMVSLCNNATLMTEVQINRFCLAVYSTSSQSSSTTIDGLNVIAATGLTDTAFTRAICEFESAVNLVSMPGKASITIRNIRGPLGYSAPGTSNKQGCACIGYTGYTSGAIEGKLEIEVVNVHNTMPQGSFNDVLRNLSGSKITSLDFFVMRDNVGMRQTMYTYSGPLESFDFSKLREGTVFTVDLAAIGTVLNAPPWQPGSTATALVEVIAATGAGSHSKYIRVTVQHSTDRTRPKVWITYDNATTWLEVGANQPSINTADFTVGVGTDVLINDKSGSACVVTLPSASTYLGRRLLIKTIQPQAVNSASSNVVPLAGGAAGTAIVTGTAGKYAELVSDGTNWIIMTAN